MATRSSILTWRIPWTEAWRAISPWGRKESDMTGHPAQSGRKVYSTCGTGCLMGRIILSPHIKINYR